MRVRHAAMIAGVLSVLTLVPTLPQAAEITGQATVTDGDTLEIRGESIRLQGIDAPESDQLCGRPGNQWRCGQKATNVLKRALGSAKIRCEYDGRGSYGRIIGTCYKGDANINAWMVANGWALAYREYSRDYVPYEQQARKAGRGIWRGAFVKPWNWRDGKRLSSRGNSQAAAEVSQNRDCSDFNTYSEAKAFFDRHQPGDPHNLDGNGDGQPCESLK